MDGRSIQILHWARMNDLFCEQELSSNSREVGSLLAQQECQLFRSFWMDQISCRHSIKNAHIHQLYLLLYLYLYYINNQQLYV